jgi:hypothetical protein
MNNKQIIKQIKEIVISEKTEYKSLQYISEKLNINKIELLKIIIESPEFICTFNNSEYNSEIGPYIEIVENRKNKIKKMNLNNKKNYKNLIREKRILYLISELINEKKSLESILKRFSITFKSCDKLLYDEFIEIMKKYDIIISELIKNNDIFNNEIFDLRNEK